MNRSSLNGGKGLSTNSPPDSYIDKTTNLNHGFIKAFPEEVTLLLEIHIKNSRSLDSSKGHSEKVRPIGKQAQKLNLMTH